MPKNLIPESKMVRILADIHLAEAQVESTVAYPDTALMAFGKLQNNIWKKHGVTEDQFRDTYNFYSKNIKEMDRLYEIITDTLIAREAKYATKGGSDPESDEINPEIEVDSTFRKKLRKMPGAFIYDTGSGLN
jgi:hypothetical protein